MSNVVRFPSRGHSPQLSKRQIANHLHRTTRWVELMVRDEGMPAGWDTHHRERRFDLQSVEAWMLERAA